MNTITEIRIRKAERYETNPGRYVGEIKVEGTSGALQIPMAPEVAEPLMLAIGPIMVKFANLAVVEVARDIEKQLTNLAQPAIEMPKEGAPDAS